MAIDPNLQLTPKQREDLTSNIIWFDSLVRHQIFILRMSGSIRNDAIKALNKSEAAMANRIREKFRSVQGASPANLKIADALVDELKAIRGRAWMDVELLWKESFKEFTIEEVAFAKKALETALPVTLNANVPTEQELRKIINTHIFDGKTLKQWSQSVASADLARIEAKIKIGLVQGQSADIIARSIVGTAKLRGRDGVTQISRRNAEGITRTATIAFSNAGRQAFYQSSRDIIDEELYVATLDGETTAICRSLDGDRFPVGEGWMPPVHFNCRSLRVAIITEDAIGNRPTKPVVQKRLLREYTDKRGFSPVTKRSQLPRGTKGSFDEFSRRRTRELIGTVPAKTTYSEWLSTQSAEFQDDVLGVTKGKLFRNGGVKLDRFVNRAGDEIPLKDLARSDAKAFKAAGLDPDAFKE